MVWKRIGIVLAAVLAVGLCARAALTQEGQRERPVDFAGMLLGGLRSTPGCLKADAARFTDGRLAIMAWFEDREAAVRWYHHPMHARFRSMLGALPGEAGEPLEHVEEGVPVLVIASMVIDPDRALVAGPMPIAEISIELYTPLPGGAMFGGRLAPEGFRIEHMRGADAGE